jgi:hypothetical protein
MEARIQLRHPAGKKAVRMDIKKYDVLKKSILSRLKKAGDSTLSEILHAIKEDFKKNKIKFEGSVEWHFEWVKLDLEANKIIERIPGKSGMKFRLRR